LYYDTDIKNMDALKKKFLEFNEAE